MIEIERAQFSCLQALAHSQKIRQGKKLNPISFVEQAVNFQIIGPFSWKLLKTQTMTSLR